jgi:purine-nucleoside phosphorylase
MSQLGIQNLIISNATGATNESYQKGDVVFIRDHINLHPDNPLRGIKDEKLGPRFPDLSEPYAAELLQFAQIACTTASIEFKQGVYFGLPGPSLETPAEYAFIHHVGGDMVGMSTVHEVIAANQCGMKVCALSVITNVCYPPERIQKTTLEDVLTVAQMSTPNVERLVTDIVQKINSAHN